MRAGDGWVAEFIGHAIHAWHWDAARALDCPLGILILAMREERREGEPKRRGFGWAEMDAMDALDAPSDVRKRKTLRPPKCRKTEESRRRRTTCRPV